MHGVAVRTSFVCEPGERIVRTLHDAPRSRGTRAPATRSAPGRGGVCSARLPTDRFSRFLAPLRRHDQTFDSQPANSTTTAGPFPCTAAKFLPNPPRRVPTAITSGSPVPGVRIPRGSGQASSTTRTDVTARSGTRMSPWSSPPSRACPCGVRAPPPPPAARPRRQVYGGLSIGTCPEGRRIGAGAYPASIRSPHLRRKSLGLRVGPASMATAARRDLGARSRRCGVADRTSHPGGDEAVATLRGAGVESCSPPTTRHPPRPSSIGDSGAAASPHRTTTSSRPLTSPWPCSRPFR